MLLTIFPSLDGLSEIALSLRFKGGVPANQGGMSVVLASINGNRPIWNTLYKSFIGHLDSFFLNEHVNHQLHSLPWQKSGCLFYELAARTSLLYQRRHRKASRTLMAWTPEYSMPRERWSIEIYLNDYCSLQHLKTQCEKALKLPKKSKERDESLKSIEAGDGMLHSYW